MDLTIHASVWQRGECLYLIALPTPLWLLLCMPGQLLLCIPSEWPIVPTTSARSAILSTNALSVRRTRES